MIAVSFDSRSEIFLTWIKVSAALDNRTTNSAKTITFLIENTVFSAHGRRSRLIAGTLKAAGRTKRPLRASHEFEQR
jgi:hypothetical protein